MMRGKRFSECSYSLANLALIIGALVALAVLIAFIQDDPLYEFIEYLLSLAFYRELIYVLVIVPLVLLVPIYNCLNACFLWRSGAQDSYQIVHSSPSEQGQTSVDSSPALRSNNGDQLQKEEEQQLKEERNLMRRKAHQLRRLESKQCVLAIKLVLEFFLLLLVFIALIFIGPNISSNSLASHIDLEMRKHMAHRYNNDFSYEFLDLIQEEYECCDVLWYQANMFDRLPASCYRRGSNFMVPFEENCSESLGSLVASRCALIAACLLVILIALAILIAVDIFHWFQLKVLSSSSNGPQFVQGYSDARYANSMAAANRPPPVPKVPKAEAKPRGETENLLGPDELVDRLRLKERERQELISSSPVDFEQFEPLPAEEEESRGRTVVPVATASGQREGQRWSRREAEERAEEAQFGRPPDEQRAGPPILTRANYAVVRRERSQSPAFVDSEREADRGGGSQLSARHSSQGPIRGVLKKTSSYQRISVDEEEEEQHAFDEHDGSTGDLSRQSTRESGCESLEDYAERLRQNTGSLLRQQQTRRSLLNVRFADP